MTGRRVLQPTVQVAEIEEEKGASEYEGANDGRGALAVGPSRYQVARR